MDHVKNLAGNAVSIFLFRFELHDNGIDFVLNQAIAADMYHDKQSPRSSRQNALPVKRVDGALLMGHQYLACALV
jgi:hypothetical protein